MAHFEGPTETDLCGESIGYLRGAWEGGKSRLKRTMIQITAGNMTICEVDGTLTLHHGDTPTLSVRLDRNTPSSIQDPLVIVNGCTTEQVYAAIGILMRRSTR